jgi:hypothetical protein
MNSKNAIDTIFKIEEMLSVVISKIDILETSMNNLNNKMYVINSKVKSLGASGNYSSGMQDRVMEASTESSLYRGPTAVAPSSQPIEQQTSRLVLGNVRVYGYILNKAKKPLGEVYVRIFTDSNEVAKETKTNREGYWECRMPAGRFSVEYTHKNFKPINVMIDIPEGSKTFEVK